MGHQTELQELLWRARLLPRAALPTVIQAPKPWYGQPRGRSLAYRLDAETVRVALRHIVRYGDTDLFPHLPELTFFQENEEAIIKELSELDLDTYTPNGSLEALAPKN